MVIFYWGVWLIGFLVFLGLFLLDLVYYGLVVCFDDWVFVKMFYQFDNCFWNLVVWVGEFWVVVVYVLILIVVLLVIYEEQVVVWVLWMLGIGNVLGIIIKKIFKCECLGVYLEYDDGYFFFSGYVLGGMNLYLMVVELWLIWLVIVIGGVVWLLVVSLWIILWVYYVSDVVGIVFFVGVWFIISILLY